MSDERGRQLERQFRESGDEEALAAWLLHRLRSGVISERRVRAAALLGSQAAFQVIETENLGIIGKSTSRDPSRLFMSLACLEPREWFIAVLTCMGLIRRYRGETIDNLNELVDADDWEEIAGRSKARLIFSGHDSPTRAQYRRLLDLAGRLESEDAAWDITQGILGHLQRYPVHRSERATSWEDMVEAVANRLIPRLIH